MQKLSDLDKKAKFASKRQESDIFSQTMPAQSKDSLRTVGKSGIGKGRGVGAMGSTMAHDEGPYSKVDWASKKG